MAASVSSGRPDFSLGLLAVILAVRASSDGVKSTATSSDCAGCCCGGAEFGLTVTTTVPVVPVERTV